MLRDLCGDKGFHGLSQRLFLGGKRSIGGGKGGGLSLGILAGLAACFGTLFSNKRKHDLLNLRVPSGGTVAEHGGDERLRIYGTNVRIDIHSGGETWHDKGGSRYLDFDTVLEIGHDDGEGAASAVDFDLESGERQRTGLGNLTDNVFKPGGTCVDEDVEFVCISPFVNLFDTRLAFVTGDRGKRHEGSFRHGLGEFAL